jgi:hypothetical protein
MDDRYNGENDHQAMVLPYRQVHFAADDLDIRPGLAGACGLHRLVELAKRGDTRSKPVGATKRLRNSA